jgi:Phage integrase family.
LQTAVERGYVERNIAHGIRIRSTGIRIQRRFYSPAQVQQLLPELQEPCRTVVQVAVLAGLRIGEILALRWKRIDLLRDTLEVAETFSDRQFGTPKTRSSHRVIPISLALQSVLTIYRSGSTEATTDSLVFTTRKGTPLSAKTCTTVNLRLHVTESNSHGYRGIRFGIHMRRCSRN